MSEQVKSAKRLHLIQPASHVIGAPWLKRYKELHNENHPLVVQGPRVRGEFRVVKKDTRTGQVTYDSGWNSNTILDNGITYCLGAPGGTGSGTGICHIGDSNTAAATSQTGLQGTKIGTITSGTQTTNTTGGSPTYLITSTKKYHAAAGTLTGTWREFCLAHINDGGTTSGFIRHVISPDLVKGAADEVSLYHRLYVYRAEAETTGTMTIDGTSYNYNLRNLDVDATNTYSHPSMNAVNTTNAHGWYRNGTDTETTGTGVGPYTGFPSGSFTGAFGGDYSVSYGGGYSYAQLIADIDNVNDTITAFRFPDYCKSGWQLGIGKVSDGTGFTKENTHEFIMTVRWNIARYP